MLIGDQRHAEFLADRLAPFGALTVDRPLDLEPSNVLAERLALRSRSSDGRIEHRLRRIVDEEAVVPDATIVNTSNGDLVEVLGNLKVREQIVTKGSLFIDRAASGS